MRVVLDLANLDHYRLFLRIKTLPHYRFIGREAEVPDEYAHLLGMKTNQLDRTVYAPLESLFDYQRDISRLAIHKQKFAVFADPGLGKTLIMLEFVQHCAEILPANKAVLIVSPLMVIEQTLSEAKRFYGDSLPICHLRVKDVPQWLSSGTDKIGIVNYEAFNKTVEPGRLGAIALDESSMLKSMYGKWATNIIDVGKGIDWKLCLTGTPAPNDRIEYGNHAVFLDQFTTLNAFLSRFFVNRGQTDNRWELKAHALRPFYTALSHWCIFLANPATYGWKDNVGTIPPIHVHIHDVPLTDDQHSAAVKLGGDMFGTPGGITSRSKLSQLAKGSFEGASVETRKPQFIRSLVRQWEKKESTIIWCLYNQEQQDLEHTFPSAASIKGATKHQDRVEILRAFQAGEVRTLISKPEVLGFGLNLQIATRQVFSGLEDSFEDYYQAVKRSNRIGSTKPLNVHIPVTDIERPMIETVLRKAKRVQQDTDEQEHIFKENGYAITA